MQSNVCLGTPPFQYLSYYLPLGNGGLAVPCRVLLIRVDDWHLPYLHS